MARMQQRQPSGWYVIYLNLESGFFEEIAVDFVVICTGICSLPHVPSYPVSPWVKRLQQGEVMQ